MKEKIAILFDFGLLRQGILFSLFIPLCLLLVAFLSPVDAKKDPPGSSSQEKSATNQRSDKTPSADGVPKKTVDNSVPSKMASSNSVSSVSSLAIICLAIISIFSLSITFWLYRWRRIVTAGKEIVVPEDWRENLNHQTRDFETQRKKIKELEGALKHLYGHSQELAKKIESMTDTFMSLQGALNEKDKEIKRLQGGYDAEIFRKFLNRFIRVDQVFNDYLGEGSIDLEGLEKAKTLLEDAFDECGMESFKPMIGQDFEQEDGVADHPKIILNEDPTVVGKIVEIREQGYRLHTGEIIRPAKVSIYGTSD